MKNLFPGTNNIVTNVSSSDRERSPQAQSSLIDFNENSNSSLPSGGASPKYFLNDALSPQRPCNEIAEENGLKVIGPDEKLSGHSLLD